MLYETAYEIPSSGYCLRALTGVTYVHDGGRWLAIADQGVPVSSFRREVDTAPLEPKGAKQ